MPRIRSLKPEIWEDESLGAVPIGARLLFIGLITQADDEGRLRAGAPLLRGRIFPYDQTVSPGRVAEWLDSLVEAGLVTVYDTAGQRYAALCGWRNHQKVDHPSPSRIPAPPSPKPPTTAENPPPREDSRNLAPDLGGDQGSRKGSRIRETARERALRIYTIWQQQPGTVKHRDLRPDAVTATTKALQTHTEAEVTEAIQLYATVLTSNRHYWSKQWTLAEFLNRGLDRFLPETHPLERFLRQDNGRDAPENGSAPPRERSHEEQVDAARATFARYEAANGREAAIEWLEATYRPSIRTAVLNLAAA